MTFEQTAIEIMRTICRNFLEYRQSTKQHDLIVQFEEPDLLFEMGRLGLLRERNNQLEYLPSAGSFAVLNADDPFYLRAERSFVVTLQTLRQCFKTEDPSQRYDSASLAETFAGKDAKGSVEDFDLGLYLCLDFGIYSTNHIADDGLTVSNVGVSSAIIRYKDPVQAWGDRHESARRAIPGPRVSMELPAQVTIDGDDDGFFEERDSEGFWSLLHPSIIPEVQRRFRVRLYPEAVEVALKVVCSSIRERTGLDWDGVRLMNEAFSPSSPTLLFDSSGSETAKSMQEGYHRIFQGAIMAIRNPKAHGFVEISRLQCIHFLFFASLLAFKVEEASAVTKAS